jgi:hypothetical protein
LYDALQDPWCGTVIRQALLRADLKNFDATTPPPRTETTTLFIEASMSNGETWAAALVRGECWPANVKYANGDTVDFFTLEQLRTRNNAEYLPDILMKATVHTAGRWLKEAGAHCRRVRMITTSGEIVRRNVWVFRNWEKKWRDCPGQAFFENTLRLVGSDKKEEVTIALLPHPKGMSS